MSGAGFKFLVEKPLQTTEEISASKFGHEEIANTLVNIVKECPAPFTVGLFAKWGSGKSTVANSIHKKLPEKKIPVILFDVWKHEGDALRRTFLKETVRQLKLYGPDFFNPDFVLDEKMEQSISRSSDSKFVFQWEKFKQIRPWLIGAGAALVIGALIANHFGYLAPLIYIVSTLFTTLTAGGILVWIVKQSLQLFSTETVSYGADKFSDPHQFEEEFGKILAGLKNPRILIIFDNLDRVVHDKVAEVLATIKTFLEPQDVANDKREVIFLVPCDAKAIKQHLTSVYGSSDPSSKHTFDPDEFLRKFFNTIVWIPDFIPSELEAFARSRLKETEVDLLDNDYVAWIITKAFRNNPRQVIQFTNILLANYLLVAEREGDGKDFEKGFLKENIPQLTKYLVLNQLFPDEMDIIREKKILDLNEVKNTDLQDTSSKESFLEFVEETRNIPITDLRSFFTLRRSEQEKQLPGFNSLIAMLEDRQIDDAKKAFIQLGDPDATDFVQNFSQAIKKELESKTNPVSTIGLIHTLFEILKDNKLTLTSTLYEEINTLLNSRCKSTLHTVPPGLMEGILLRDNSTYRNNVVDQWLVVMEDVLTGSNKYKSDKEFVAEVIKVFARNPSYLNATQNTKLNKLLSNNLQSDLTIAQTIANSPEGQQKLATGEYLRNFLNAVPNGGNLDDISSRLSTLNQFDTSVLAKIDRDVIVDKYTSLISSENALPKTEGFTEKAKLLNPLRKLLKKDPSLLSNTSDQVKDRLIDSLIAGYNALPDFDNKSIFTPTLFEIRSIATPAKIPEIESALNGFTDNTSPPRLNEFFTELSESDQKAYFEGNLYTSGANRSARDPAFRTVFFPKLSDTRKKEFLGQMFTGDIEQAIQFIESLDKKDVKNVWTIFPTIWPRFDSFSTSHKQRLFKFINKYVAGNDAQIRDSLATKIVIALTSTDPSLQQVGLEAIGDANSHISDTKKRAIAKEAFDWLKKPETTIKYQPHTLRAILSEISLLNEEEQKEFTHFLFDEIVRKSGGQAEIVEAFNLLKEIRPKYEDRKQNYDDVRNRIEAETDPNIKATLIRGLSTLAPDKSNQNNKDFWAWVKQQEDSLPF